MGTRLKIIYSVLLVLSLLVSGAGMFSAGYTSAGSHQAAIPAISPPSSNSMGYQTTIVIHNNGTAATPTPFDEMIVVNSSMFSVYENRNLSNIWFSYTGGARVPSWLQSGNSSTDSNTTYWLRLNSSIAAGGSLDIHMNFLPVGSNAFNNYSTGEAPEFTNMYGVYDDGSHVFNFYDNFSGTSVKNSIWNTTQAASSSYVINNGITFVSGVNDLYSQTAFPSPGEVEAYGIMNTPAANNSTSCFLGGAGFGNGGIHNTQPVMTAGWAENDSNMLGLSIWNGNGNTYTYNVSKSISPYVYHIFGTGYLNGSATTISIDNVLQNVSHVPLGTNGKLNVVLGFQSSNFPKVNHFYWIFERNTTTHGFNLPYSIHKTFPVTFVSTGLPSGNKWSLNVENVGTFNYTGSGSNVIELVNGSYNITVTGANGYIAYPGTMNFSISGSGETFDIAFESPSNTSFIKGETSFLPFVPTPSGATTTLPGYNTMYFATTYGLTSVALDSASNHLFVTGFETSPSCIGLLANMNLTGGGNQIYTMKNVSIQTGMYYDQGNGYLYVPTTNGLSIIDASTFHFVRNVTLVNMTVESLTVNTAGNTFYLLSINNAGKVNVTSVSQSGKVLGNLSFANYLGSSLQIGQSVEPPLYFDGNLLLTNGTGVLSLNLSGGGKQTFSAAPKYYVPISILPFGSPGMFLIGNESQTTGVSYIYNANTGLYTSGPPVKGAITASAYDAYNGNYYLWSGTSSSANITEINALTDRVIATAPSPGITSSMIFDPSTQSLFAMDYLLELNLYTPEIYKFNLLHEYKVTFTEKNLGAGTWYVNVTGEPVSGPVSGDSYSTYLPNGTYSYSVSSTNKSYSPSYASSFTVSGSSVNESIAFSLVTYTITFSESGLPSGDWYANLSGTTDKASAGSQITFSEPNGTYTVNVHTGNNLYRPSTYSETITVDGSAVSEPVKFVAVTYTVTFVEKGLSPGTNWTLTIDHVNYTANGTSYAIQLQNGTYSYSVSANGYSVTNQTGTIAVSGSGNTTRVTFTRLTSPSSGLSYVAYGGIAAAAIVLAALLIWRRKGARKQ
ncbi:MAG: hypothetical protein M1138_05690 [Candidatus Thermoplasmatota archaeon]|nr:hypothetical protein [Candidatus Thermoplasmatota archaeon]